MKVEELSQYVPVQYVVYTALSLILIFMVILRFAPIGIKWFNTIRKRADHWDELEKFVKDTRENLEKIDKKVDNDYERLNKLQTITENQQRYIDDSLEERELIVRSLFGVIKGLQELGANGPTKAAESELNAYLVKKSHDPTHDSLENMK